MYRYLRKYCTWMIPQHLKNYNGNPPQGLVKSLTIWYIKRNLWGYGKS